MAGFWELLIISMLVSLALAVMYRVLTNPEDIRRIKKDMEFYREKVSKAQKEGNKDEIGKASSEMLKLSQKQFRASLKPLVLSLVIFFFVFSWISATYAELIVPLPFNMPFIGPSFNWFWVYVFVTVPFSMVFRKLLGVE